MSDEGWSSERRGGAVGEGAWVTRGRGVQSRREGGMRSRAAAATTGTAGRHDQRRGGRELGQEPPRSQGARRSRSGKHAPARSAPRPTAAVWIKIATFHPIAIFHSISILRGFGKTRSCRATAIPHLARWSVRMDQRHTMRAAAGVAAPPAAPSRSRPRRPGQLQTPAAQTLPRPRSPSRPSSALHVTCYCPFPRHRGYLERNPHLSRSRVAGVTDQLSSTLHL